MTMAPLKLTVACDDFDTVRPLIDGRVGAEGLDLAFVTDLTSPKRHARMVRELAFDVCELNISTYLIAREQGVPLTAIPVFLFRKFRHGNVFVNTAAGIAAPADLAGRRVGAPNMQPAANVWIKGILQDQHGLAHRDIVWVVDTDEEIGFPLPSDIRVERAPPGRSLTDMLVTGELPALITPLVPAPIVAGDPRVRRLFPDYKARERAYFEATGIFPIMHVTAIKQEIAERHPWVAAALVAAFEKAKQAAYRRMANVRLVPLAWFGAGWEEEQALFGGDAWPNGLGAVNRHTLRTAIDYTCEQGLIRRAPAIEEVFIDTPGIIAGAG